MWGDWLEKGKQLASKAQAAALEIDKQINQSVGIADAPAPASGLVDDDDDDVLNDAWGDNDDLAALDDETDQKVGSEPCSQSKDDSFDQAPAVDLEPTIIDHDEQKDASDDAAGAWDTNDEVEISETIEDPLQESEAYNSAAHEENEKIVSLDSDKDDAAVSTPTDVPVESTTSVDVDESGPVQNIVEDQKEDNTERLTKETPKLLDEGSEGGNDDLDMIDISENVHTNDKIEEKVLEDLSPSEMPNTAAASSATTSGKIVLDEINETDEVKHLATNASSLKENLDTEQTETKACQVDKEDPGSPIGDSDSFRPLNESEQQNEDMPGGISTQNEKLLEAQIIELNNLLRQREEQLMNKTVQLTEMTAMFETEKQQLQQKVVSTKEEAKQRIQKAKERVEAMEARLKEISHQSTTGEQDAAKQAEIIAALRGEGEKLAHKQAEMEKAVRTAKGDARRLREELDEERTAKDTALAKIESLESELKNTKDDLSAARRGESQAEKLDTELRQLTEENNMKAATILSFEQQVKELKDTVKEQEAALQDVQNGAAIETEREIKRIRKEHNDAISDMEAKLHTTEREAGIREDALRHEIAELRKRWQDAVRRADSLSMDIQSSTAPLLRQIESAERQSRTRTAAWAELESSLRSQLEEAVISNEQLSKEKSDLKTRNSRIERALKEHESELKTLKHKLDQATQLNQELQDKVDELELKNAKMKEEYSEVQRLANEGVSKVRSEMSQTVMENEERHQAQIESIRKELQQEREKRSLLEKQVDDLVDKAGMIIPPILTHSSSLKPESQPVRLRQSENQIDILNDALGGFGSDDEDEDYAEEDPSQRGDAHGSLAALAELTSRLKTAKFELDVLHKQLSESECARDRMVTELNEARAAKEKLPLFEAKVQELTRDNKEMAMEIQSLQDDIAEVKEMYRSQLDALLEEKAARKQDAPDVVESTADTP